MSKLSVVGNLRLDQFGVEIYELFGERAYLVGSALEDNKDWNDVDVRVMLGVSELKRWFGKDFLGDGCNRQFKPWAVLCLAFSALGKEMTGLPIDFQIQSADYANKKLPGKREPLGVYAKSLEKESK